MNGSNPRAMVKGLRQLMRDKEGVLRDDATERLRHAARRYARTYGREART